MTEQDRNAIAVDFLPLVEKEVASLFSRVRYLPDIDEHDLQSCGAIALLRAVERFDARKSNACFRTFAVVCVRNAIRSELRRSSFNWGTSGSRANYDKRTKFVSLERVTVQQSKNGEPSLCAMKDEATERRRKACPVEFKEAMESLNGKAASVCRLVYEEGFNPREAADRLGISHASGYKLHAEGIRKIRKLWGV